MKGVVFLNKNEILRCASYFQLFFSLLFSSLLSLSGDETLRLMLDITSKMVYKRIRRKTSGGTLPLNFFEYPLGICNWIGKKKMQLVKKNPKPLNVGSQQVRALIVLREKPRELRSRLGLGLQLSGSIIEPVTPAKHLQTVLRKRWQLKLSFFCPLPWPKPYLRANDALYLKRTFYSDSK